MFWVIDLIPTCLWTCIRSVLAIFGSDRAYSRKTSELECFDLRAKMRGKKKKLSSCALNQPTTVKNYPELIRKHLDRLCVLARARPGQARGIIDRAPASFLKALSLIAYNLTQETVKLRKSDKIQLSPYARHVIRLSKKSLSSKERRKTLLQRGGFLGTLLGILGSTVLPAIISAVT